MNDFDWKNLIDPLFYIHFDINGIKLGVYIVLFIVFAETGLFAGFFLPGDSLLFLAGIYSRELIENILIIDNDFVAQHNIGTQFFKKTDIDRYKVESISEMVKLYSDANTIPFNRKINEFDKLPITISAFDNIVC